MLGALCEALVQRLGPAAGELADGGALAAATSLVTEDAAWLRLALQACAVVNGPQLSEAKSAPPASFAPF